MPKTPCYLDGKLASLCFGDIIGQHDEKAHFDLYLSAIRYKTAIFEITIFY